ncbi:hypothetical protein DRO32_04405 [Candidatus Bathyarchaeota archaeon]|nr:MAG: hypothetical protein DRO32_04405 [Candidatus Bathyarchaeota archaeon]
MPNPLNTPFLSCSIWVLRFSLCLTALSAASLLDLRRREVPDALWLLSGPPLAVLTALWLLRNPGCLTLVVFSLLTTLALAAAIYFTGIMGGADSKALVLIAVACPTDSPWDLLESHPFTPLASFSNALVLTALLSASLLIYNLAWRMRTGLPLFEGIKASRAARALALLSGFKAKTSEVLSGRRHLFPLEVLAEDGSRELSIALGLDLLYDRLEALREASRRGAGLPEYMWVSPGLPMVLFITAGFVMACFLGDLLFSALSFLLGLLAP